MRGVDCDRDGADGCHGNLEVALAVLGDVNVSGDGSADVSGFEFAARVHGHIRIACLGVNPVVLDDVFEGIVHQAAIAALVPFSRGAVDQVLFTKRNERSCGIEVLTFHRSRSAEGPA